MKEQIEYIRKRVEKFGTISIHTGKLTDKQAKAFSKHFKMKKQPFGYTSFSSIHG